VIARRASGVARRAILGRIVLALFGGYGLAAALARGLAAVLPGARVEAAATATLIAYLGYVVAALFAFAPKRAWIAWVGVAGVTGFFLLLSFLGPR
jgi:hypothetical protein